MEPELATTMRFGSVAPPAMSGDLESTSRWAGGAPALPPAPSAAPVLVPAKVAPVGVGTVVGPETAAGPPVDAAPPPLLLDVTPHTLSIETVGGFCEGVIKRNAAIPVEQTKIFSTARDDQDTVAVRICQGESRRLAENQGLGEIELSGLRRAPRGEVKIGVTFMIDADGTLGVRAQDLATGREQTIRINLVGGVPEEEIRRMMARQEAMAGGGR
jgi:molecular chaperone DnaK